METSGETDYLESVKGQKHSLIHYFEEIDHARTNLLDLAQNTDKTKYYLFNPQNISYDPQNNKFDIVFSEIKNEDDKKGIKSEGSGNQKNLSVLEIIGFCNKYARDNPLCILSSFFPSPEPFSSISYHLSLIQILDSDYISELLYYALSRIIEIYEDLKNDWSLFHNKIINISKKDQTPLPKFKLHRIQESLVEQYQHLLNEFIKRIKALDNIKSSLQESSNNHLDQNTKNIKFKNLTHGIDQMIKPKIN